MNHISSPYGRLSFMVATCLAALVTLNSYGALLDASQEVVTYPPLGLQSGSQNVKTNLAGFYDFSDRNGDSTAVAVTPAGLDMTNRNLTTTTVASKDISLKLNGGNLMASTGSIKTGPANNAAGNVYIYNVGSIAMGDGYIYTRSYGAGHVYVGQNGVAGPRAGSIQVNGIVAFYAYAGGNVTVYGSSDVLIKNASGVATDIVTSGTSNGRVLIQHDGTFLVQDVLATCNYYNTRADLFFDGDVLQNGASGTFTARLLDTHDVIPTWGAYTTDPGNITVSNYTSVSIGSLDTHEYSGGHNAGSVKVGGIAGDIKITGMINLDATNGPSQEGSLTLTAGGNIQVTTLNMDLVGTVTLTAGQEAYISVLTNFNKASPATSGLLAGNSGSIYYSPANNPDLVAGGVNGVYALAQGTLKPKWPTGTMVLVR